MERHAGPSPQNLSSLDACVPLDGVTYGNDGQECAMGCFLALTAAGASLTDAAADVASMAHGRPADWGLIPLRDALLEVGEGGVPNLARAMAAFSMARLDAEPELGEDLGRAVLSQLDLHPLSVALCLGPTEHEDYGVPSTNYGTWGAVSLARALGVSPEWTDRASNYLVMTLNLERLALATPCAWEVGGHKLDGARATLADSFTGFHPAFKYVHGNVFLEKCPYFSTLPDGFRVDGSLLLRGCGALPRLPQGLIIQGDLDLRDCGAWDGVIPEDAQVGGYIYTDAYFDGIDLAGWRSHSHGKRP